MQVGAAFDPGRVFPEHHFRCLSVGPRSDMAEWARTIVQSASKQDVLLWLTAIINSPVAHAWVAMSSPPRGMHEDVLHSLPIPARYDDSIPRLVAATKNVVRPASFVGRPIWGMWSQRPSHDVGPDFETLAGQINSLLLRAYGLTVDDFEMLRQYLEGTTNPSV